MRGRDHTHDALYCTLYMYLHIDQTGSCFSYTFHFGTYPIIFGCSRSSFRGPSSSAPVCTKLHILYEWLYCFSLISLVPAASPPPDQEVDRDGFYLHRYASLLTPKHSQAHVFLFSTSHSFYFSPPLFPFVPFVPLCPQTCPLKPCVCHLAEREVMLRSKWNRVQMNNGSS